MHVQLPQISDCQVMENTCLPTTTYTQCMSNMIHNTNTDIGITHVQHAGDDSEG
jgi:hypothetical protein